MIIRQIEEVPQLELIDLKFQVSEHMSQLWDAHVEFKEEEKQEEAASMMAKLKVFNDAHEKINNELMRRQSN